MPFEQTRLDRPINGRAGTFDRYFYRNDEDSLAQIRTPRYFSASRFLDNEPENWIGAIIDVIGSDGYSLLQVDSAGTGVIAIGGSGGFRLGPVQNTFADSAARDTYFSANPENLARYDADELLLILVGTGSSAEYQQRVNNAWQSANSVLQGPQGLDGDAASLANVTVGHVPYKDSNNTLADSGAQVLSDGTLLAPGNFNVEGQTILFGDLLEMSENNSLISLFNRQFANTTFRLIDARNRRTTASERPRQLAAVAAERFFELQPGFSQTLTANPLIFSYTAALDGTDPTRGLQTNDLQLKANAAMTNVRVRVRYGNAPNTPIKYLPSKAAWEAGTGGMTWTPDGNNDIPALDLGNSDFIVFEGDQIEVEVRADNMAMLGELNVQGNAQFPYLAGDVQDTVFMDLAYLSDINQPPVAMPRISSFAIAGQPTSVAPGTTITGSKTFTYAVENPQLVQGQMELVQGSDVLSGSVSPTGTMVTVTVNDATLMAGQAAHFTLRGTSTSGQTFSRDVTIRAAQPHEFAYYGIRSTNDFATTDLANLTSTDVTTNNSFEVSGAFANSAWVGILMPADMDLDDIRFFGQPVTSSFTRTENARTISGQAYVLYTLQNGSGVDGQASYLVEL